MFFSLWSHDAAPEHKYLLWLQNSVFGQRELFALFVPGNVCVHSVPPCDSSHVPADPSHACSRVRGPSRCLVSPQGYDNTESSVRKASVFCLVAIYSVIGEDLKPHLAQLTGSKVGARSHTHTHSHTLPQTQGLIIFPCLYMQTGFNRSANYKAQGHIYPTVLELCKC